MTCSMVIATHWQLLQVHPLATQAEVQMTVGSVWVSCTKTCDPEDQISAGLLTGCDSVAV